MAAQLLTLNAGSSSLKFALYARDDPSRARLTGIVEGLGTGSARMRLKDGGGIRHDTALDGSTHADALAAMGKVLAKEDGAGRIAAIGHRVVHGGAHFDAPARIDAAVLAEIESLASLAPLHQPHNVAGIRAAQAAYPEVPQLACFDTAFHRTQAAVHQRFAIAQRWHDAGIRRYGFHGLSYESIVQRLDGAAGRTVVAHLGNGASMCAIRDGRSVATTMSFSPLDGLTMGTRCGHIDAAVVLHLIERHGLTSAEVTALLFRESGLLGLSGLSSDMRTLEASTEPAAQAAIDHFVEQVVQGLAAMAAAIDGIDRFVFTGGIGENAAGVRERVLERAAWMGIVPDRAANRRGDGTISSPGSAVEVRVIATDEEGVIARSLASACA